MNRNVVACAVASAVVGFCGYSFLGLYPTYLKTESGFSTTDVGLVAGMFAIGSMPGIPAGWLGDRFNPRWVLIIATGANMALGWLLFNVHTAPVGQALLSIGYGTLASGVLIVNLYALVQRSVSPGAVGRASGVFLAATYLPASVSGYAFAALQSAYGWGVAAAIQMTCLPVIGIAALLALDLRKLGKPTAAPTGA
ncbi:MFS transporter [Streptomyces sp. Ru72]|uniref:MFS transporter n=1 Tax=Streptomyces sp. Ru72 TaxID=2080747 RepID=UPI000CDD357B|nr:MFS transporter [Streptomyces sp. Ru72]POX51561.1 hypothetical protein C3488_10980 [Streptomyces sp. Ru72]